MRRVLSIQHTIRIEKQSTEKISADVFIIATGSMPHRLAD
jgi:pyruvate/2-oxoglutarate dehydrogenase complex dihydrolipoamide dehydrogenase (E3) component